MHCVPTRPATPLVLLALLLPLAACSSARHSISTSAGAPNRSAAASPGTSPGAARSGSAIPSGTAAPAPQTGGFAGSAAAAAAPAHRGSVTVLITRPVTVSGAAAAPVSCVATSGLYVALVSRAQVGGYTHSFTVRVAGYHGTGAYRGQVSVAMTGPQGTLAALNAVGGIPVAITRAGGSAAVRASGSGHRTLDATLSWTCP